MDEGQQLRDAGIERVATNNANWMDTALESLRGWLSMNEIVTIERFRSWFLENGGEPPKHHNAWGALGRTAVTRGLLRRIGYVNARSAKTHSHPVAQYQSTVYLGRAA